MRSLVHGFAISGESTAVALRRYGHEVTVTDDAIDPAKEQRAVNAGFSLGSLPDGDALDAFVCQFDLIAPAPGVPEHHRLIECAQREGVTISSEIEIAYATEQQREGGPRPILAVTGTDGKTTTCELAVAMLRAGGVRSLAVGNTDVPFIEALEQPLDVYVVECTSFRLAWSDMFRADAAVWLNLAPDHLNWHRDMSSYEAAKAKMFTQQHRSDIAIGGSHDPVVMAHLKAAPSRQITFGFEGDYHFSNGVLMSPRGPIISASEMTRSLPHDITNALAAAALVMESGLVGVESVAAALRDFEAPAHRLQFVAEVNGVRWFNDSKATTPHAASAAVRAFPTSVLIAGGRNKDLDLTPMAVAGGSLRGVVAIGEAASEISDVFGGMVEVVTAGSMETAVDLAARLADGHGEVVLSPGCASFDWYPSGGYPARGEHYIRLVKERMNQEVSELSGGAT
jgi:UDP-N-acetylmuramoylalanine--D-glutamate ligase